ncbi:MAG: peptide chain release factor N(5)-glutamine methyltransferase, partial [Rickettsiales bacterium]|nr:peptide chain release factor N(5)-glutamine methyltransferase [Rickettsiales bacterium]
MTRLFEVLKLAEEKLRGSAVETPRLDAEILLSHITNIPSGELFFLKNAEIDDEKIKIFNELVERRCRREPVAKITHKKFFWKYEFFVNGNVLDPRPETETLVECALEEFKNWENLSILDLGTGSGCIIISLLKEIKNSRGVAVDLSLPALQTAKFNAVNLGVFGKARFLRNYWNRGMREKFDVIVSNPPYVETETISKLEDDVKKYEPPIALDGGRDGLDCYKYLAKNLKKNCRRRTKIFLEIGRDQAVAVKNIFEEQNFVFH